jgi:hypothetical protein
VWCFSSLCCQHVPGLICGRVRLAVEMKVSNDERLALPPPELKRRGAAK